MAVRRQIDYGATRGMPWGISESAYIAVDRAGNYQYKAFGVPGSRPEARPRRRARRRAVRDGARGDDRSGAQRARICAGSPPRAVRRVRILRGDRLHRSRPAERISAHRHAGDAPTSRTTQGMSLVALANALLGDVMVARFHADPRVQATELLLQERVPRQRPITAAAAAKTRCSCRRTASPCRSAAIARRTRSSRTPSSCRTATTRRP